MMKLQPNYLKAWLFLTTSLAFHVLDEALNDFLAIYNPLVTSINQQLPFSLFPVFTFSQWLTGLILGIIILYGLSFFVLRGARWTFYLSYFYAIVMIFNAIGHIVGSIYYGKLIAGAYSAPLLLLGSIYLIWSTNSLIKFNSHND